jgi:hypothetical protein
MLLLFTPNDWALVAGFHFVNTDVPQDYILIWRCVTVLTPGCTQYDWLMDKLEATR